MGLCRNLMRHGGLAVSLAVALGLLMAACEGGEGNGFVIIHHHHPKPPVGACLPSSSLAVEVVPHSKNVVSYVPKGAWDRGTTGVSLVQIEGKGISPAVIDTPNVVNSCSSNSVTGETVCVASNTDVYLISGSTLNSTQNSSGTGTINFSGGTCTNCGVTVDPIANRALIGLSLSGGAARTGASASDPGGYQFLDLSGTPTFETAFATSDPGGEISEDLLFDSKQRILSASEDSNYEIVDVSSGTPAFFENFVDVGEMDSSAEDCSTQIALASIEFSSNVFIADLSQATFTPGTPGSWNAPSQSQPFAPDFDPLSAGTCGIAVAQGTHTAIVTGEFGGDAFGVLKLPASGGGGTPAATDYVACSIPNDPNGNTFSIGLDPHTVTAYQSPNSGHAIALIASNAPSSDPPPTFLAVVDITKMLDTSIVPRTKATHTCDPSTDLQAAGVVRFVPVP